MSPAREHIERFACFGGTCAVLLSGEVDGHSAREGALQARRSLLEWHLRFSRFEPGSELSLLNEDPRREVPASEMLVRIAAAVRLAGELSGGLVDATLAQEIENAGYAEDLGQPLSPALALALAPPRRPARPAGSHPSAVVGSTAALAPAPGRWRQVRADVRARTVTRPPGVRIDGGGLAKGLFADLLAKRLARYDAYAVDCAGDLAVGGSARLARPIHVECPFGRRPLHTFELIDACVATSGITRRSWLDSRGHAAHHLLDPATGEPAFTGIVQVTALAPSALEAEVRAKAALLAGPQAAATHLPHGGVVVFDDGSHRLIEPPLHLTATKPAGLAHPQTPQAFAERGRAA
jgi:thiamine biosynthesis lipoprotein